MPDVDYWRAQMLADMGVQSQHGKKRRTAS
jgi:hypothetical protein